MSRETEGLIRHLSLDLDPVQPLPKLRWVALGLFSVAGLAIAVGVLSLGLRPDLRDWASSLSGLALLLGSVGILLSATVAALGASIPGREALSSGGVVGLFIALALIALGLLALPHSPSETRESGWALLSLCATRAAGVGLVPAAIAFFFSSRAYAYRAGLAFGLGALGMAASGGIAIHLACPAAAADHIALGHLLFPLGLLALGAMGLQRLLSRDPR